MKTITAFAIALLVTVSSIAQTEQKPMFNLGIEIAPTFTQSNLRLSSGGIGVTATYGIDGFLAHLYVNETNVQVGGYMGNKNMQVGLFASIKVASQPQPAPMFAFRCTKEIEQGFSVQVGIKLEVAVNTERQHDVAIFIGVQKRLGNGKAKEESNKRGKAQSKKTSKFRV